MRLWLLLLILSPLAIYWFVDWYALSRRRLHHIAHHRIADLSRGPRFPPTREAGFYLIEVLIALVIAGIALGAVFQAATGSIQATTTAARYQEAISRARSHLDGAAANLVAGNQEGDDGGGFRWRVAARPVDSTGKQDAAGRAVANTDALVVTLYAITVWITWKDGLRPRAVRLDTERLLVTAPSEEIQG